MPALAALISIGPDTSDVLMDLYNHPNFPEDRTIAIFGLPRIQDPRIS